MNRTAPRQLSSLLASVVTAIFLTAACPAEGYQFFEADKGGCKWTAIGPGHVDFLVDASSTAAIGDALLTSATTARNAWNDIATARDVFGTFTKSPADFTEANFGVAWGKGFSTGQPNADGQQEVVLDETGQIMTLFGLNPLEVNGFGPSEKVIAAGSCTITDALLLLNGTRNDFDRDSTIVHEFGHIQGLAHSSVGMHNSLNSDPFRDGYASPGAALDPIDIASTPTMHPFSNGTGSNRRTPEQDDIAGLSDLYPEASFFTAFGGIAGTVTRCFENTVLQGVNVRAISVADAHLQVSRYTSFDGNGEGRFNINGLPPGDYRVVVEEMGFNGFTAGRMAIKTKTDGNFATEYYGPTETEEADCTESVPDEALAVAVSGGTTRVGIDVKVGGAELAFVVDDTGSMEDEINAVRDILSSFVGVLEALSRQFPTVAIVTFKDGVTLRGISNDPARLRGIIDALYADSGDDCPESANAALLAAGKLLRNDGVAILFTDADSRPNGPTADTVSNYYRSKSLSLSVLLSATCEEEFDDDAGAAAQCARCRQVDTRSGRAAEALPDTGDEYPEPPMLGYQDAVTTFAKIAAETGGVFRTTPRPSPGDRRTAYVNTGTNISVSSVLPAIGLLTPARAPQGATLDVEIRGANTNWNSSSTLTFVGTPIVVNSRTIHSASTLTASISVPAGAAAGFFDVKVDTDLGGVHEIAVGTGAFQVTVPSGEADVVSVIPSSSAPGTTVQLHVTGLATDFDNDTALRFARRQTIDPSITVNAMNVENAGSLRATITVANDAAIGPRDVVVYTNSTTIIEARGFLVAPPAAAIPRVVTLVPSQAMQGSTLQIQITGQETHFVDGTSFAGFSGTGITVLSTTVSSSTTALAEIGIAADAALGFRDAFVTTGDESAALLDGFQIVAGAPGCTGDCNDNGAVTVDELVTGVNIALGAAPLGACSPMDARHDGLVTVDELGRAVDHALNGCPPPAATPTPTQTTAGTAVGTATPTSSNLPTVTRTSTATVAPSATQTSNATVAPTITPGGGATVPQSVAGGAVAVANGMSVIPAVISAIASGVQYGSGAALIAETGGGAAGACPQGGTATRSGSIPGTMTLTLSNCTLATAEGLLVLNGTATLSGILPPLVFTANLQATFKNASGTTTYRTASAVLNGTINPQLGGSCYVSGVTLVLGSGTLGSQFTGDGGVTVTFSNTSVGVSGISYNGDCVPVQYSLTFNGPATVAVTDGAGAAAQTSYGVNFASFVVAQDARSTPTQTQMSGNLTSDCFGGTVTLSTRAALLSSSAAPCPTGGVLRVTAAVTADVLYSAGGQVGIDTNLDGSSEQTFPSCLDPALRQCVSSTTPTTTPNATASATATRTTTTAPTPAPTATRTATSPLVPTPTRTATAPATPTRTATPTPTKTPMTLVYCSTPNLSIPDDDTIFGASDSITIPAAAGVTISRLRVQIDIDHTWVGDLVVYLDHIDELSYAELIDQVRDAPGSDHTCGGTNIRCTLDDAAAESVQDQCSAVPPAVNGTFQPFEPLGMFNGESSAGTWTLSVYDVYAGDTGTLLRWCIEVN